MTANQRVTVTLLEALDGRRRYKGYIQQVSADSLYLVTAERLRSFGLSQIAWVRPAGRGLGWVLFSIGAALLGLTVLLLFIALVFALDYLNSRTGERELRSAGVTSTVGIVLLVVGLVLVIMAPRTIKNPGSDWNVEVQTVERP